MSIITEVTRKAREDVDSAPRDGAGGGYERTPGVAAFAAYLDARLCVPRDMGGPPAEELRKLHRRLNGPIDTRCRVE